MVTDCTHPKSRKAKRCRACQLAYLANDPDVHARRLAAIRKRFEDPAVRGRARQHMRELTAARMADPEALERMREHGRKQYREVLSRPDVIAKHQAPDVRKRAGQKRSSTVLGDIPPRLRDEYRRLKASKLLSAAEAREIILDQYKRDIARA